MLPAKTYLVRDDHTPQKAAVPVIDAHNHLWGNWQTVDTVVAAMDAVGVQAYCDLTANVSIAWGGGGYQLGQGDFDAFRRGVLDRYPGRFYGFTTATFAQPIDRPLFTDAAAFVDQTLALLREHVAKGALGLKILKELGLHYRDGSGQLLACDDPRLAPVWEECAKLGIPVLIHQSDPIGFFEPITPDNEHYDSMVKYPSWSFADPKFPRKPELLARRDNLLRQHPRTTFILPHVANNPEDLRYVAKLLDDCPNACIDFSARMDELGRQPYSSREFFLRYQDRIVFGSDMPATPEMYRCYFRFLETRDEGFYVPDYDGTFSRRRWPVCGLGLPARVLEKVYRRNILRLIPALKPRLR